VSDVEGCLQRFAKPTDLHVSRGLGDVQPGGCVGEVQRLCERHEGA